MRVFLLAMTLSLALSSAYADFSNPLDTVSQVATNVSNVGTVTTDASPSNITNASAAKATTPMAVTTLARMNCTALEVAMQNTTRELKRIRANIERINHLDSNAQLQQHKSDKAPVGALGGLLANKTDKSDESASATQSIADTSATSQDQDMDTQLALGRKYSRDLNNITIYQKHKNCPPLKD